MIYNRYQKLLLVLLHHYHQAMKDNMLKNQLIVINTIRTKIITEDFNNDKNIILLS